MKFDNVLVATDGSTLSDAAIDLALHSVGQFAAKLTFVYVVDNSRHGEFDDTDVMTRIFATRLEGETILEKAKKTAADKGVSCVTKMVEGIPWQVLSDMTKEYDMLIMSTTGKGSFGGGKLGSTAAKVIENAFCPILTLKSSSDRLENVLLPVDSENMPAIDLAISTVKRVNGKLTILSVKTKEVSAENVVESISKKCEEAGINYVAEIREGSPVQVICGESGKYELVIMGTHARKGISKVLKGSVAEAVVVNAMCPVTVVRNE